MLINVRVVIEYKVNTGDDDKKVANEVKSKLLLALDAICNPDRSDSGAVVWYDDGTCP